MGRALRPATRPAPETLAGVLGLVVVLALAHSPWGQAQGLRILSLGAKPLDRRAITVLSLDALKTMADGQATKIIFPFELTGLIRQTARFLGAEDDETGMGESTVGQGGLDESILGDIPKAAEVEGVRELVKNIESDLASELDSVAPPIDSEKKKSS